MYTVIPPDNKNFVLEQREQMAQHHGHNAFFEGDGPYRTAERVKDAISASQNDLTGQLGRLYANVDRMGLSNEIATEKVGAANSLATEKIGAANQLATEKVGAELSVQVESRFSDTQNLLISGFKDGRYDAATLTASILQSQVVGFKDGRYDAAVNTAALQAALSECCCEL